MKDTSEFKTMHPAAAAYAQEVRDGTLSRREFLVRSTALGVSTVAAYGLLYKSHVTVDLFSGRLSKKTQAILSLICYLFMYFPFIAVWIYFGVSYAANSWQMWEKSWSIWGPPLYPIKTVIPIAAAMLLLQGISEVIKTIDVLVREKGVSQ